ELPAAAWFLAAGGAFVTDRAVVDRDEAAGAAAVAVAAGDAAAAGAAVVIDGAVVDGECAGDAEDAAAAHPARRNGVPAHLAVVEGERRAGAGAHRAARDPAASARGHVGGDDAAIELQRAREIDDATAEAGRTLARDA